MELLQERYEKEISGVISCYDRMVIRGTLPSTCYPEGMAGYLARHGTMLFDYTEFMKPFREETRMNAEKLAEKNGLKIIFVKNSRSRKEDIVKKNIDEGKKGLVCILSAMEACPSYLPWHDKITHKTSLRHTQSKCLHYYFYFNDPDLGLGYVRVPTWAPFQLQIYFNGHSLLSNTLQKKKIGFSMLDNAFDHIDNFEKAQKLSDELDIKKLHKKFNWFAGLYCPVYKKFDTSYHWSIMQLEYSTDIVFKSQSVLHKIYPELVATAIHTVKPDHISTFLGQKLHGNYEGEIGNYYHVRIEGSCVKHSMGAVSIKMYDKFSKVLRIETTVNNVSQFKHYREVVHRDGTTSMQQAPVKKGIYSLEALSDILKSSNRRYIEFISAIEDHRPGKDKLNKITSSKMQDQRRYKGINFFEKTDLKIMLILMRGEFNINGFSSKNLKKWMPNKSSSQISRILKRLRVLGLIKKVNNVYKYYVTVLGKAAIATGLKIKNIVIIPQLDYVTA